MSFFELCKRNKCRLFTYLSCVLTFSIMTVLFTSLSYYDCKNMESCVYSVNSTSDPDCIIYYYELVINNRTGCRTWCADPLDFQSCPIDGDSCQITEFVRDYCKYQGFAEIFDCWNETYYVIGIICCTITIALCVGGFVMLCAINNKEEESEETTPLVAK